MFYIGVMKRVLRPGMGATVREYIEIMKARESEKAEDEQRRFEDDDVQVACKYMLDVHVSSGSSLHCKFGESEFCPREEC